MNFRLLVVQENTHMSAGLESSIQVIGRDRQAIFVLRRS